MRSKDKQELRAKYTALQRMVKNAVRKLRQTGRAKSGNVNLGSDYKQHMNGEFFRKLRKFDKVSVQPPDVILD